MLTGQLGYTLISVSHSISVQMCMFIHYIFFPQLSHLFRLYLLPYKFWGHSAKVTLLIQHLLHISFQYPMQDHFNVPYNPYFFFKFQQSVLWTIYIFLVNKAGFFSQACYRQFSLSLDNKAMEKKTQIFQD